jgi:hypothetical protein
MELNPTNLGPKRSFTVAEDVFWAELCEMQCAARVAEVVTLEEVLKASGGKIAAAVKDAAAIRCGHSTATSITNYLRSPVIAKRPKLVRKSTKAAAAEAAKKAAEAEALALLEKTKRLAAECEAMDQGALTEALAKAAESGDPLRERWHAQSLLHASDLRAARFGEMSSARQAAAAETAAADAAVAAAAVKTTAASKAAAVGHKAAAKAAAAANERRALGVRTLSKKPDLPKEPGGGERLMGGEDLSMGAVFGVGPGSAPTRQRRRGCWRASPRAAARPS